MKKIFSVLLALFLASSSILLGGCSETQSDGADYIFDYAMVGNPESLDPQYASDSCLSAHQSYSPCPNGHWRQSAEAPSF